MARGSTSRWRREADRVIAEALAALPMSATEKERKAALRAAYPFGQRAYLPYKHWLAAQKAALAPVGAKAEPPPVVRLEVSRVYLPGRLWLFVRCDWCRTTGRDHRPGYSGCMACGRLYKPMRDALALAHVRALLGAGAADETAALVALDAAEEATGERPHLPPAEGAKGRRRKKAKGAGD